MGLVENDGVQRGNVGCFLAVSNRFPLCTCVDSLTREMSLSVCCHIQSQLCPRTFCVLKFLSAETETEVQTKTDVYCT